MEESFSLGAQKKTKTPIAYGYIREQYKRNPPPMQSVDDGKITILIAYMNWPFATAIKTFVKSFLQNLTFKIMKKNPILLIIMRVSTLQLFFSLMLVASGFA